MWGELPDALDTLDFEKIKRIIEKNPERINEKVGNTICNSLQYICWDCNSLDVIKYDKDYHFKKYNIIKFLLESGANVNAKIYQENFYFLDYTPLMFICEFFNRYIRYQNIDDDNCEGIVKILELLLNYGADVNIKTKKMNKTSLHILLADNPFSSEKYYQCNKFLIKMIKLLIEKGVDINIENNNGKLAIEYLLGIPNNLDENSEKVIKEIIKIMIEYGLDIDKIKQKYSRFELFFTYHLENRIKELEKEIEELRYKPGNPGYFETMKDFEVLKGKKNE